MSKCLKSFIWCDNQDSMFDNPVHVIVHNLKCSHLYTLHAFTVIEDEYKFESFANYKSNSEGYIDLKTNTSVDGSFIGIEPMGLFWSMKPSILNKHRHVRMIKKDVTKPLVVTINLYDGFLSLKEISELDFSCKNEITQIKVNRRMMSPGTEKIPLNLNKHGIHGSIFIPDGEGCFPGVIIMYGFYSGTQECKAALLASYGFATLALSFIGLPGLPEVDFGTSLQLEYFEKATQVLLSHPKVDKNTGIGLIGLSFSSFIVLMMSSFFPCIKCVIWLNGYHYPLVASITYKDKKYPLKIPSSDVDSTSPESNFVFRKQFSNVIDLVDNEINYIEIPFYNRHDVGYMFIACLNDNNVPSEYYINQIEKLMKASKHPNYQLLRYPGAGHLLEPCYGIHHRITKAFNVFIDWGGETIPHCKAQEDSWKKQIEFLKLNLFVEEKSKL